MQGADSITQEALTLSDAEALVAEIERLRAHVAELEERIGHLDRLAHCDALVDLPNRRSFLAQLDRSIARVARYGDEAAMLFVDMDGLKQINDRFGHTAGDRALVETAHLLVTSVRKSDYVARIGGDEFGILLERIDERGAWEMALRIVESVVASQFSVEGCHLPLSVAVGVGAIRADDDAQSVIERADKEMYRVKAA
ncbi:MAG TPA: GGDEF domain-containing protein [Sphingomicrobium sp.]|nr:GGDEF domain-containing protein [Sphingomicrobium sp.]